MAVSWKTNDGYYAFELDGKVIKFQINEVKIKNQTIDDLSIDSSKVRKRWNEVLKPLKKGYKMEGEYKEGLNNALDSYINDLDNNERILAVKDHCQLDAWRLFLERYLQPRGLRKANDRSEIAGTVAKAAGTVLALGALGTGVFFGAKAAKEKIDEVSAKSGNKAPKVADVAKQNVKQDYGQEEYGFVVAEDKRETTEVIPVTPRPSKRVPVAMRPAPQPAPQPVFTVPPQPAPVEPQDEEPDVIFVQQPDNSEIIGGAIELGKSIVDAAATVAIVHEQEKTNRRYAPPRIDVHEHYYNSNFGGNFQNNRGCGDRGQVHHQRSGCHTQPAMHNPGVTERPRGSMKQCLQKRQVHDWAATPRVEKQTRCGVPAVHPKQGRSSFKQGHLSFKQASSFKGGASFKGGTPSHRPQAQPQRRGGGHRRGR